MAFGVGLLFIVILMVIVFSVVIANFKSQIV